MVQEILLSALQDELVRAVVIVLLTVVAIGVLRFPLKRYGKSLAAKTKTDVDDAILQGATFYVYVILGLLGLYVALAQLSYLAPYSAWVDATFFVLIVVAVARLVSRTLGLVIVRWLQIQERFERAPQVLSKIVSILIYLIAFIMILGHFQVEITPLVAALGLGGLAIGLALKDTLSNFFAGLHILSDKPIRVGDFVRLEEGDAEGFVDDIGWRSTRILTMQNNYVIVPNARLAETIITNYTLPQQESATAVKCGVSYGSDLEKVERVTLEVAQEVQKRAQGAVDIFEPMVRFTEFGDSNVNFVVILRVRSRRDRDPVVHEFIKALKARYDKEGIEISGPVRKIYYADKAAE